MKILMGITYYLPHLSGLTVYVQTLSRSLVERGHEVTIYTYRHDKTLPLQEVQDGITIIRVPPLASASRGVFSPRYIGDVSKIITNYDICHLHHPMLELGLFTYFAKKHHVPTIITYHCDLRLPKGMLNTVAEKITNASFAWAAKQADAIIAYSQDFKEHSEFLHNLQEKTTTISPPIVERAPKNQEVMDNLITNNSLQETTVIGYAGRVSEEKGADILVRAIPFIKKVLPSAKIVIAGQYEAVRGETFYQTNKKLFDQYKQDVVWLGAVEPKDMNSFYNICDVLVVPSRRETFAMVQIEAMLQGIPVVATDIYGAREPIKKTGMGLLVEPQNPPALANGIIQVLSNKQDYVKTESAITTHFSLNRTISEYERLYTTIAPQS